MSLQFQNGPEFKLSELISWLNTLQLRYENSGEVTAKRSGASLAIFQAGTFRASVDLDNAGLPITFADNEA